MAAPAKKICYVTTTPLIVNFFLVPILLHMRERYTTSLAVTHPGEVPLVKLPGIEVFPVHSSRQIDLWRDAAAFFQLLKLFRGERFDLIHSFGPKAGLLAGLAGRLAGVPCRVHTFTGQVWAARGGASRLLLKAADRITARVATHVLIDSLAQRDFLAREGIVSKADCEVLGRGSVSGVDLRRFKPDPHARESVRVELGIKDSAPIVLFLGRLKRDKGVLDLAAAFSGMTKTVPDTVLVFVGPDEERLREQIVMACGESAARAKFVGYTDLPERYLAACDVLCLPSYREGFGTVLIEAAATGVPAVASRIYGVEDAIVDGETGMLFEAGNVQDMRDKLTTILARLEVRSDLGL